MYELVKVTESTFYMDCPAKVGFYKTGEREVVLIDSGSDKDAAKKVKRILDGQGWELRAIFDTHSHADHTGGNSYLQEETGCRIFAPGADCAVAVNTILEPVTLYGGFPMKELLGKFLMAKSADVEPLVPEVLPDGLEMIPLPGHSFDMAGFRTADGAVFLADCLSGESTLEKYQISFLYDVKAYLDTLEKVKRMEAVCFIPAHAPCTDDISPLAELNIKKTLEISETILRLLETPKPFETLLAEVFTEFGLVMNLQQRMLVGSTVKSYLSYLKDGGRADFSFENNLMLWSRK